MKDHEKDDRFLAAQVEKVESLRDAKAKNGGFPVAHPYYPNMGVPAPHRHTHKPGGRFGWEY